MGSAYYMKPFLAFKNALSPVIFSDILYYILELLMNTSSASRKHIAIYELFTSSMLKIFGFDADLMVDMIYLRVSCDFRSLGMCRCYLHLNTDINLSIKPLNQLI